MWGLLGLLGLRLSAVPAVLLVSGLGVGAEVFTHLTLAFITR